MKTILVLGGSLLLTCSAWAQSLGNAGTIEGTVSDQSGAAVTKASIGLHNAITGYGQSVSPASDGSFRLVNIPPGQYHVEVSAPGFAVFTQDVSIRGSVPVQIKAALAVAGSQTTVNVEAAGADVLENNPSAHVGVDRTQFSKLPVMDPAGGLSQAITFSTGGVAADGNGLFHPLGDHAQSMFLIDGQPVSDQQSKVFSTQLPMSAIQSMEITTGTPGAEFGDKTSLIAQVTTRSGLGTGAVFGNVSTSYGSFANVTGTASIGFGSAKVGNFLTVEGVRSGRFLDTPELRPLHDTGNNQTLFDRFDYLPTGRDAFHLNIFAARNWFQIPNDLDQLSQDQRQRVLTWSIAPGYQHTLNAHSVLTINPYVRKDQVNYYPTGDFTQDQPATESQNRQLMNWGVRADLSTTQGRHNYKYGLDLKQTRLLENFGFGITDPTFNSPCVDASGNSISETILTDPSQCVKAGYQPNIPDNPNASAPFSPGLLPYDLTRKGGLFNYHATANINQYAFYAQDAITASHFLFTVGFRLDSYHGLATKTEPEPRIGVAYNIKRTGTVLRTAYARTQETPFNENLLLSSATGIGGLAQNVFGATGVSISPGFRNQFNTGLQQAVGRYLLMDVDYFWKFTHNAYDFSTLLNTTLTFPIAWHNSKLDGVTGRVSTVNLKGFQAYWTFGHTRARYFPPEDGGLISQGAPLAAGVFRIDHDQAFQSTANFRYQRTHNAEFISLIWRYDSGLVVSGIPDSDAAINLLTANQQVSIGLACGGVHATVANPISSCGGTVTSKLLTLPQAGMENDDHNPDRVKPRNVFNLGIGTDNLLHAEGRKRIITAFEITNLTNKVALYNFLSTFSGTHFLAPRALVGRIGLTF